MEIKKNITICDECYCDALQIDLIQKKKLNKTNKRKNDGKSMYWKLEMNDENRREWFQTNEEKYEK